MFKKLFKLLLLLIVVGGGYAAFQMFWERSYQNEAMVEIQRPPGAVADGADVPGTPLTVTKAGGDDITLSWDVSCVANDANYAIYEGLVGDFTSHVPLDIPNPPCTTFGATTMTVTPAAGSSYYLVVPQGDEHEGSYGSDNGGVPRPPSVSACKPQLVGACE